MKISEEGLRFIVQKIFKGCVFLIWAYTAVIVSKNCRVDHITKFYFIHLTVLTQSEVHTPKNF